MSQRVLIALSSHGYGHLGQITPVMQALKHRQPGIELFVRSRLPEFKLREKLGPDIRLQSAELDVGMIQKDALTIDLQQTAQSYARFHEQWEARLDREKQALLDASPDLIIANIPYLTLAAAHQLGIPAIAFCSLNWAELYQYFFQDRPESGPILKQMLEAYNQAACFLRPVPAMNMPGVENAQTIGPIAQIGRNVSEPLRVKLGLSASEHIVLVSLGGMDLKPGCENWPRFPGTRLLVPESWHSRHPDTRALEPLGYPFADLLRSCDVLIAKPGYGSFVEAACTATPVLYLPRPHWPEAPILIDWLSEYGTGMEMSREAFQSGAFHAQIQEVIERRKGKGLAPTGIEEAVETISRYLRG